MRKTVLIVGAVFATFGLANSVIAQSQGKSGGGVHYRWVDGQGLPHYSDALNDEAVKYGYDLINAQGIVVQHVQRAMSPAERAAAAKQAQLQAIQQRAADEHARDDIQLLNTYPDETALKTEQREELNSLDEQMHTTRVNLHSQDGALTDLLDRAADDERAKQPVPKFLSDQITSQRNVVASERALLGRQQAQRDTAEQQQAQQLQHYRDLKAAQKTDRGY